jgi:diguanylate cyclase (GGDEF)-like protein/PAS domain S-box-containing protein
MDSIRKLLLGATALGFAAILSLGWLAYKSHGRAAEAADRVSHTQEVIGAVRTVRSLAEGIESSQRGYVITGDASYVAAFEEQARRLAVTADALRALTMDNLGQQDRIQDLKEAIRRRVELLRRGVALRRDEGFEKARELVAAGAGRAEMERLVGILDQMSEEERRLLGERKDASDRGEAHATRTFGVLAAVGTGLFAAFLVLTIRAMRRHRELEEERDRFFTMSLDMLCIAGVDGYFKRVNPAFGVLGWSAEELRSRPFLDFVHPDDVSATNAVMDTLEQGVPLVHFENRYRCKDGSYRWLQWSCRPAGKVLYAAATDVTARKEMEEVGKKHADEMRALTLVDELTNLGNRRGFVTLARQYLRNATRNKQRAVVLFIDLDGLKAINDQHGHQAGDAAIRSMADVLRKTFRDADILARLGGDEFVALAADCADPAPPLRRMEALLKAENLSASVGYSHFDPAQPESVETLVKRADEAMYVEKQKRKAART